MVSRPAALPLGILMVGLGGMLLFVAFHNLPADIGTFPQFLGYMTGKIQGGVQ